MLSYISFQVCFCGFFIYLFVTFNFQFCHLNVLASVGLRTFFVGLKKTYIKPDDWKETRKRKRKESQHNNSDKNHCIRRMPQIFAGAFTVHIVNHRHHIESWLLPVIFSIPLNFPDSAFKEQRRLLWRSTRKKECPSELKTEHNMVCIVCSCSSST